MTFRRSGGITTYTGPHAMSRGSLADIRHGGGHEDPNSMPEQDREWLKQVYAASMTLEDSAYLCGDETYMDEECDIISRLWGVYYNTCPYNRREFNDDYFSPSGR